MLSRRALAGVGRAAAGRSAYPCWFRVIGGLRVLAVFFPPYHDRGCHGQFANSRNSMTADFRGNNTDLLRGATEVAAFLAD